MLEVIKYTQEIKGKVVGYVDVLIPKWGIKIRRIAHLMNGEREWFNYPSSYELQENGFKKFFPYVEFASDVHNKEFLEKLASEVKTHMRKNGIEGPRPLAMDEETPF